MKRWTVSAGWLLAGVLLGSLAAGRWLSGQGPGAAPVPKELTSYRDVVKKTLPAVVSIEITALKNRPGRPGPELPPGPGDGTPSLGFGSGFLIDPSGVVLTNFHVVEGAEAVDVVLLDGRRFPTKDLRVDPKTDLALARIEAKGPLPFLELGDSAAVEVGDRVLAMGAPFGLAGSVTAGIVSARGRSLRVNPYEDFLQTDAAVNPGNSGGPLVSLDGKAVGVIAAIKSRSGGFQGVGLAVPSDLAKTVVTPLLKEGVVRRAWLGLQVNDLADAEVLKRLGTEAPTGVVVTGVYEGSPAEKAGVQDGDLLFSLGGKGVASGRELALAAAALPVGKPVELVVLRDGKATALSLTVEEQPAQAGTATAAPGRLPEAVTGAVAVEAAGMEVVDVTAELAKAAGYREGSKGVLVWRLEPTGPAARSGLRRGMLIVQADGKPLAAAALRDALSADALRRGVLLRVQTPTGGTHYALLRAG